MRESVWGFKSPLAHYTFDADTQGQRPDHLSDLVVAVPKGP